MAEREKVLAREPGSAGRAWLSGFGARVALAGGCAAVRTLAPACGTAGPSAAARGRLSEAAVHASDARRRAFVLCRGKPAAPGWPSSGASSEASRARGLATRETSPFSPSPLA